MWLEKHKREDDTDTQLLWIYNQNKKILHDMFSTDCLDQNDLDHLKELYRACKNSPNLAYILSIFRSNI